MLTSANRRQTFVKMGAPVRTCLVRSSACVSTAGMAHTVRTTSMTARTTRATTGEPVWIMWATTSACVLSEKQVCPKICGSP